MAGLVGSALNALPIPVLASIWPGRLATLPVAILAGPWNGLIAAAVMTAPMILANDLLWPVFLLEALAVGVLVRRRPTPLMTGGLLWIGVGVVSGVWGSSGPSAMPASIAWSLAAQRALNGLVAVAVADLELVP